jgi:hypothetical protein
MSVDLFMSRLSAISTLGYDIVNKRRECVCYVFQVKVFCSYRFRTIFVFQCIPTREDGAYMAYLANGSGGLNT